MTYFAADVAAVVEHLALPNAVHIGHPTGGGEALHYVTRHGQGWVAKLVLVDAVPPIMLNTRPIRAACRSRCSTASGTSWRATARNSISMARAVPSTASTGWA
jgi:pimeloyl-ACP methyl ester carboxylesterase